MKNQHLWSNIIAFEIDKKDAEFTFSKRLARENHWNLTYTKKVVLEYKKFIYLCCISESQLTPSDAVDQVWHLHLTYTKSYWKDLCGEVLKKEIHHNPTKGGAKEKNKFTNCYHQTFELYQKEFGVAPPPSIWFGNKERFKKLNHKRVNPEEFWLIKKPSERMIANCSILLVALTTPILFVQAENSYSTLVFLLIFMVLAIIFVGRRKRSSTRHNSKDGDFIDTDIHNHDASNDSGGDSSGDGGGCSGGCGS